MHPAVFCLFNQHKITALILFYDLLGPDIWKMSRSLLIE